MKKFFAIISVILTIGFMISDLFGKEVKVSELWAPASAGDVLTGVAYLKIENESDNPDSLVAVQTEAADRAALQQESDANGTKTLTEIKTLDIPGGQSKVLKPQGIYIMLTGLKKPLVKGSKFPLTLVFDKKGIVEKQVVVEDGGATAYQAE